MNQEYECDGCGNVVQYQSMAFRTDIPLINVTMQLDVGEFETNEYTLCNECRRKIVDWIEDMPESERFVEPISIKQTAELLEEEADRLMESAESLREYQD